MNNLIQQIPVGRKRLMVILKEDGVLFRRDWAEHPSDYYVYDSKTTGQSFKRVHVVTAVDLINKGIVERNEDKDVKASVPGHKGFTLSLEYGRKRRKS